MLTPSIRAIRENFPRAYITLVVTKPVYPMAELCPYVNEVIPFEMQYVTSIVIKDLLQSLVYAVNFSAQNLWRRHFDICFTFVNDIMTPTMSYISGAKIRTGMGGYLANVLLNKPIPYDYNMARQLCEINLYLLQTCGLKINSTDLELWCDAEDLRVAKNILKDFAPNRLKIAFGLGATNLERKYPVEKYRVTLKEIIKKGAAIIILGGPSEVDDAKFLEKNLPAEFVKNVVELKPSWRITTAIISLMDMYLGNDTGTQHVAAALKKPVVVLSRDSKDHAKIAGAHCNCKIFAPYGTKSIVLMPEHSLGDCAKNLKRTCDAGRPHCIAQIQPEEIVAAFEKMLQFIKI